jgi:hypothetical protein
MSAFLRNRNRFRRTVRGFARVNLGLAETERAEAVAETEGGEMPHPLTSSASRGVGWGSAMDGFRRLTVDRHCSYLTMLAVGRMRYWDIQRQPRTLVGRRRGRPCGFRPCCFKCNLLDEMNHVSTSWVSFLLLCKPTTSEIAPSIR